MLFRSREIVYLSEDVVVERQVVTTWLVASDGPLVVALDPTVDATLAAEGLARELIHHIQRLRREAGYSVSDRIELGIEGPEAVLTAVRIHAEFIRTETLIRRLEVGSAVPGAELTQEIDIEGQRVTLSVRRHGAGG